MSDKEYDIMEQVGKTIGQVSLDKYDLGKISTEYGVAVEIYSAQ